MEALVSRERAVCNHCACKGVILDRHMRGVGEIEPQEVVNVEDYEDWGLFVMFECACCNHGYSWKPKIRLTTEFAMQD